LQGKAWHALRLSLTFSCHIAAHHAAFSAMHLQGAIDFAGVRMRSCGGGGVERKAARSSAWQALH